MSFNEILDQIRCVKLKDDNHIVKEPLTLNCGHSICKNCFLIDENETVICAKCKKVTNKINPNNESSNVKLLCNTRIIRDDQGRNNRKTEYYNE